ncbi:hypothetical protein NPIL_600352 [Nephila pilipes]|uniref:Uncharacterized protein n=1 Tax=Nephila pilipes TaxID=299642 RepID=A0A8X6P1M0_NEPPI|nr:hypothetical protein NPIL_600352 [Nephila pilipes]
MEAPTPGVSLAFRDERGGGSISSLRPPPSCLSPIDRRPQRLEDQVSHRLGSIEDGERHCDAGIPFVLASHLTLVEVHEYVF